MMKKTLFITILIMTNLFYIFAGGEARFDGMIVLTAEGEKCITGDDHGISRSVVVYGDCEIYFNNKICSIKLWELPVGVNVLYKGGISCGYVTESGSKICRPTAGYENEVYIKTQVIKVNREGCKSYAVETLVNDLLNDLYPHINTHLKGKYKNIIIGLMNINTSRQLKQDEEVVIPVMENGFLGSNSNISSEIVFPSLYKVVRIIADQDVSSENKFAESAYPKLAVINFKNIYSVTNTIKLPKDISVTRYRMPLYYDGAKAKFVVIAAAKWFFIYDVLENKLSGKMVPEFGGVEYADSRSGNLTFTSISPDGKILFGETQDLKPFEYNVSIPSKPKQVTLSSEANKIVMEEGTQILRTTWGSGIGELGLAKIPPESPKSFFVGFGEEIYILDQVNSRVQVYQSGSYMRTIPVPRGYWFMDIVLSPDNDLILLDRLIKKSVVFLTHSGNLDCEVSLIGQGISQGSRVLSLYSQPDGIWVWCCSNLIRIADHDGTPDPKRPSVPGLFSRDDSQWLIAEKDGELCVVLYARETSRPYKVSHHVIRFWIPVWGVVMFESDMAGRIFLCVDCYTEEEPGDFQSYRFMVILNHDLSEHRRFLIPPSSVCVEPAMRSIRVGDDGIIYQMRSDLYKGVTVVKYKP